jgi:hypothetical protein
MSAVKAVAEVNVPPVVTATRVVAAGAGKGGVGATESALVSAAAPVRKTESKQWLVARLVGGVVGLIKAIVIKAIVGGILGGAWYVVRNVIIRNIPFVGRIVDNADKKAAAAKATMDKLTAAVATAQAELDAAEDQVDTAAEKRAGDRFYQVIAKYQDGSALASAKKKVVAAEAALATAQAALDAARAPKKVRA